MKPRQIDWRWCMCSMLLAETKSCGIASLIMIPQNKLQVRSSPSKCNTITLSSSVPSLSSYGSVHSFSLPAPSWPPCRDGEKFPAWSRGSLEGGKVPRSANVCLFWPNHPSALSQPLNKEKAGKPMSSDCGSAAKCSTFLDVAMHQSQCPLTVW